MRAVVCNELGPIDGLVVEERPDLVAEAGRVVVSVAAAGLNYVDALFVTGDYQIKPPVPFTPGTEIAGTVAALGDNVDSVSVGDRVLVGVGLGGYASQVTAHPDQCIPIPDSMPLEAAAAFQQSYCTALFALRRGTLREGETLLVLGAAGGVGRAAIDVGKALGARVIAAASSTERLDRCHRAGADELIDYSTEDLKTRARELSDGGVDVVLDPVGGDKAEPALRAMGFDGRFLVIGFARGDIPRLPLNQILLRNRRVVGVDWGAWMMQDGVGQRALMDDLTGMVATGQLHPPQPTSYPLDDVVVALSDLLERRIVGKGVLIP